MKRRIFLCFIAAIALQGIHPATEASSVTWSVESPADTYNPPDLNPNYDVEDMSVAIFDNDSDWLWFYLWFKNVPQVNMFNDAGGSWAGVFLDSNLDGKDDYRLTIAQTTMTSNRTTVDGYLYNIGSQSRLSCSVRVFNNIDARNYYVAFKFQRSCINLKGSFGAQGYADYISNDDKSFDYAPTNYFTVTLPGFSTPSSGSGNSTNSSAGKNFDLPSNVANASVESLNYTKSPADLTSLAKTILPSVVTVNCSSGKGTGWSGAVQLSSQLSSQGYQSYIFTNHHVVDDCISSRKVSVTLSTGESVSGDIVSWSETNDVAGVVIKNLLPKLEWIGVPPQQGWWVGVIGSPLGTSNLLTTGIISSIVSSEKKFTITAPINPGNSGGPVFDMTGRVIGLATSKRLLSTGELAEGFGIAHGTPLLCSVAVICGVEVDPWGGIPKTKQGPSPEELAAIAKADAESKAKADAELAAKAKSELDARILQEKSVLCSDFNGDLKQSILRLSIAQSTYPKSTSILKSLQSLGPTEFNCQAINVATFDGELSIQRKLLSTFQSSIDVSIVSAAKNETKVLKKSNTITCIKGKLTKTVTGINPKCPTGYKKK
jgi:hypothetical protein